jgi:hypothetical protein
MYLDGSKSCKTYDLLGYSPSQLREHLEGFPMWTELIKREWHLDHIFPVIAFIKYGITDINIINSLDNLQPLDARSNLSKAGSYDRAEFEAYLMAKGIGFTKPL